jgi:hypothetical protein
VGAGQIAACAAPLSTSLRLVSRNSSCEPSGGFSGSQRGGRIVGVLRVRGRSERALEVVEQRQDVAEQVRVGEFAQLAAFLFDAATIVLELGALAEQQVLVLVALGAQLVERFFGAKGAARGLLVLLVDGGSLAHAGGALIVHVDYSNREIEPA